MTIKRSIGEKFFEKFNIFFLGLLTIVFAYPLLYVLFASFSDPVRLVQHRGLLYAPLGFSLKGYQLVLDNPNIGVGYLNTLFYIVVGTGLNIVLTSMGAYALSRKTFYLKKPMMIMIVLTMYFQGGLIPTFLTVKNLGLIDSRLALILPTAILTWNLIVLRTAFAAVPDSLEESAKIDGANDLVILFRIIIPVSKATIAVIILFYTVFHWNSWFDAMIYLRDRKLYPIQLFLREILISNDTSSVNTVSDEIEDVFNSSLLKYSTIIVATVPILFIYPFLQKYFTKGVMIGSIKG